MSGLRVGPFTVAFDEADGEGIVFFGNFFRLAHRAFEQGVPLLGFTWKEWFANPELAIPLRHTEADYRNPLRPGDSYYVNIRVQELGSTSLGFAFEFKSADEKTYAVVKTTHVFLSRKEFKKISIPERFRNQLNKFVETGKVAVDLT